MSDATTRTSRRILDLAHPLSSSAPVSGSHVGFTLALKRRHGDVVREDGGSGASEMIVMSPHIGTHVDALCHASHEGRMHGGIDAGTAQRGEGFSVLGAETIPPIVGRAALLDVAGPGRVCAAGQEVTVHDLERAAEGIDPSEVDVILVRTGWAAHWGDAPTYVGHEHGAPGVGVDAALWLAEHHPIAVGSDTMAFECIPPGAGHRNLPVHSHLLVQEGVHIIENMLLNELADSGHATFDFVLAPLPMVGATGSPVRPLAVVPDG